MSQVVLSRRILCLVIQAYFSEVLLSLGDAIVFILFLPTVSAMVIFVHLTHITGTATSNDVQDPCNMLLFKVLSLQYGLMSLSKDF